MNVLVFDIETVPDVQAGRRLYQLEDLSDADVAKAMFHLRRQETGNESLRLHLQCIVAISAVLRSTDGIRVWSLGDVDSSEKEILRQFFDNVDRHTPALVSWNGTGFDLPVIHYRALLHGVSAPHYWGSGEDNPSFKWDSYSSRYHVRHTALMDILAAYNPRAAAPLTDISTMVGGPGKTGMDGTKVWAQFLEGNISGIRNYCETAVLNTYLIYLRFELIRGRLTEEAYQSELQLMCDSLRQEAKPHLDAFLEAWQGN